MKWLTLLFFLVSEAFAAPILLGETPLDPPLETRADLDAPASVFDERIPLEALLRFGVNVQTSSLDSAIRMDNSLENNNARLEWQPNKGWIDQEGAVLEGWNAPLQKEKVTYVPLKCLRPLGFELSLLETGSVSVRSKNTLPVDGFNQILGVQTQKGGSSRLTFSFLRAPEFFALQKSANRSVWQLQNTNSAARFVAVGSSNLSRARVLRNGNNALLEVEFPENSSLEVQANGTELVFSGQDTVVPIALPPSKLPSGVEYKTSTVGLSKLHLVRFDPARYKPEVRVAPWGGAKTILEFGKDAVAAVNGGYFDPATMQPVDLLFDGSLYAYARGNRAAFGLLDTGALFGIPRARLVLSLGRQVANINQIRPNPHPDNLTFFIGDGFVPVGGLGFTTLVLANGKVLDRHDDAFVPEVGQITVSFNPKTNPTFERKVGDAANVNLTWSDPAWEQVSGALAAGPRLVANGVFAVNGMAEGFDTTSEIWRPTRQIGIGVDQGGFYVLAMLELGTPEDFARTLVAAGLRDAVRLDSGTSAQMMLAGGLVSGRLGRAVPNALAFVPR